MYNLLCATQSHKWTKKYNVTDNRDDIIYYYSNFDKMESVDLIERKKKLTKKKRTEHFPTQNAKARHISVIPDVWNASNKTSNKFKKIEIIDF